MPLGRPAAHQRPTHRLRPAVGPPEPGRRRPHRQRRSDLVALRRRGVGSHPPRPARRVARRRDDAARRPRLRPAEPPVPVGRPADDRAGVERWGERLHVRLAGSRQLRRPDRPAARVAGGVRRDPRARGAGAARSGVGSDQGRPVGHPRDGRRRGTRRRADVRPGWPGDRCGHPDRHGDVGGRRARHRQLRSAPGGRRRRHRRHHRRGRLGHLEHGGCRAHRRCPRRRR